MKKAPFKETPRVEWKSGAWYYRPKADELAQYGGKTWVRLGVMETDVYQFLAEKSRGLSGHKILTIGQALLKYQAEVVPAKAFKTRESNLVSIRRLMKSLKDVEVADLGYPDAIEYRDGIGEEFGRSAANTDLEVLSHLYTKLIEWGAIKNRDHPLRGMTYKFPKVARDRYVSHAEIIKHHKLAGPFLKVYIPFKLKTALDQITTTTLVLRGGADEGITEEGIYYRRTKLKRHDTGRKGKLKLILWDAELRLLVGRMLALRPRTAARAHLFCNARGGRYVDKNGTAQPIRRAWARLKAHALHKKMPIDYHEHDLRAKSLSDEEELSVAIKRGDHSSGHNTTTKVYRRKAEAVHPLELTEVGLGELLDDGAMDAHVAEYFCWLVIQSGTLGDRA